MKTKSTETKIRKSITHDRLVIVATFPSGGEIKFSINRYSERLAIKGSTDPVTCKAQFNAIAKYVAHRKGEDNLGRIRRVEALANQCNSVSEFVKHVS